MTLEIGTYWMCKENCPNIVEKYELMDRKCV